MEGGGLLGREDKADAGGLVKRLKPQTAQALTKKEIATSDIYGIGEPNAFFDALNLAGINNHQLEY